MNDQDWRIRLFLDDKECVSIDDWMLDEGYEESDGDWFDTDGNEVDPTDAITAAMDSEGWSA